MPDDYLRLLAMWALAHELADDAWKAAVERGQHEGADPTDLLASLVAQEKDRLRSALESGDISLVSGSGGGRLDELKFEIGELRGRLESMETTLDAIAGRLEAS